jgi:hypothetical protein
MKPAQPLSVGVQRAVYVTHDEADARVRGATSFSR